MDKSKRVKVHVPEDRVEARYCDFTLISKNILGFKIDFAQGIPGQDQVRILSRIAMSPQHAKMFLNVFARHVAEYEKAFGQIKLPRRPVKTKDGSLVHFVK